MIELLWVCEPEEARSQATARTMLWDRWAGPRDRTCPFGIVVRPVNSSGETPLFPGWEYRPVYLPAPLSMRIGEAGIEEPMWVYLSFMTRGKHQHQFREHAAGIREITRLTLHTPVQLRSKAAQTLVEAEVIHVVTSTNYGLEIEFDRKPTGRRVDFRPDLPLLFQL